MSVRCAARVVGRRLGAEGQADERGDLWHHRGDARAGERVPQQAGQPLRRAGELGVGRVVEQLERGQPGRRGERVPRQRAGLVHGTQWRDLGHDVRPAPVGADVEATADDLAERAEIGRDVEQALAAAPGDAEAGDDLVDDEQRAHTVALGPEALEEAGLRGDQAHVGRDGLDDHAGGVLVELRHDVVGHDGRVGHGRLGDARRAGQPERGEAGARLGKEEVAVAVVVARELHDPASPRVTTGDADRRHRRLRAGGDEAHLLDRRHPLADRLGQEHLALGGRAVRRPVDRRTLHGLDDRRVGVPGDDRAVGLHQVDVAPTVRVPHHRPGRASDEVRRATDAPEGPHRAVDATRDHALRTLEQRLVPRTRLVGHGAWLIDRVPRRAPWRST